MLEKDLKRYQRKKLIKEIVGSTIGCMIGIGFLILIGALEVNEKFWPDLFSWITQ